MAAGAIVVGATFARYGMNDITPFIAGMGGIATVVGGLAGAAAGAAATQ